jgi:hypothetical protein
MLDSFSQSRGSVVCVDALQLDRCDYLVTFNVWILEGETDQKLLPRL